MTSNFTLNTDSDLVIVAHPDDESIFFAGLILSKLNNPHVICVTDGDADNKGALRAQEFAAAMNILGVKTFTNLGFPDVYENRLNSTSLIDQLNTMNSPKRVFTHGPLGEYGHPHHQDVCYAAYKAFSHRSLVYGVAHNCEADFKVPVEGPNFELKAKILSEVYFNETKRFINFVSLSNVECFCQYSLEEVNALYDHFCGVQKIKREQLVKLNWFWPYLQTEVSTLSDRPF